MDKGGALEYHWSSAELPASGWIYDMKAWKYTKPGKPIAITGTDNMESNTMLPSPMEILAPEQGGFHVVILG